MKALFLPEFSKNWDLVPKDISLPDVGPYDVEVDIAYCGINNRDMVIARGEYPNIKSPLILGTDISGHVSKVGSKVDGFDIGDPVSRYPITGCNKCSFCIAGKPNICNTRSILNGGYAEKIIVDHSNLVKVPREIDMMTAACLPVTYLTAWHILCEKVSIQPSDSIVIFGSSGGLGIALVQLSSYFGSNVIAITSSDNKSEHLKKIGANHTIDRQRQNIRKDVLRITSGEGVDIVIDPVGGKVVTNSTTLLKPMGKLVVSGRLIGQFPKIDLLEIFRNELQIVGTSMGTRTDYDDLISFMKRQSFQAQVDQVHSLDDLTIPHKRLVSGNTIGKILYSC